MTNSRILSNRWKENKYFREKRNLLWLDIIFFFFFFFFFFRLCNFNLECKSLRQDKLFFCQVVPVDSTVDSRWADRLITKYSYDSPPVFPFFLTCLTNTKTESRLQAESRSRQYFLSTLISFSWDHALT